MDNSEIVKLLQVLCNCIRVGRVNSVNAVNGSVRVRFEDKEDVISSDLPVKSAEYNMPAVGDDVLCVFLPNGIQEGYCLGRFYSGRNAPPVQNSSIYCKSFGDGTYIQYNKQTLELTVTAEKAIVINGDVNINGKLTATEVSP